MVLEILAGLAAAELFLPARAALGYAIVGIPGLLLLWAWIAVVRALAPMTPIVLLLLITAAYGLTLASIFNSSFQHVSDTWHGFDIGIYFFISILTCVHGFMRSDAIRWPLFSAGLIFSILYFLVAMFIVK